MNKKYLFSLFFLFSFSVLNAFSIEFLKQFGSTGNDSAWSLGQDNAGNILVTGYSDGPLLPGLTNYLAGDLWVMKLDSAATACWSRQFGTARNDVAYGITPDVSGNVFITGCTEGRFPEEKGFGDRDCFILKADSEGEMEFIRQFGTMGSDYAGCIVVTPEGELYIAGDTDGIFNTERALGIIHPYLKKFDGSGNELWTCELSATEKAWARAVALDKGGSVFITGDTYGKIEGQENIGGKDAFIACISSAGAVTWVRQFGTDKNDWAYGIAVDSEGNILVSGQTFGAFPGETNFGQEDVFISKFDSSGKLLWTRQFGTASGEEARAIAVDAENIYICGYTNGAFTGFVNAGMEDIFVAKLDALGRVTDLLQFGTVSSDEASSLILTPDNGLYICGYTYDTLPGQVSSGDTDAFITRIK